MGGEVRGRNRPDVDRSRHRVGGSRARDMDAEWFAGQWGLERTKRTDWAGVSRASYVGLCRSS